MRRLHICLSFTLCVLCLLLGGCAAAKKDSLAKIKDLPFTVLSEDNIPEELLTVLNEKKTDPFKITFSDNGFLYICIGYGEQETGGFSIVVNGLYLTENAIYADTTLMGPDPLTDEKQRDNAPSYPFIVLKTEFLDKPVVFK